MTAYRNWAAHYRAWLALRLKFVFLPFLPTVLGWRTPHRSERLESERPGSGLSSPGTPRTKADYQKTVNLSLRLVYCSAEEVGRALGRNAAHAPAKRLRRLKNRRLAGTFRPRSRSRGNLNYRAER